jgi:hypothetical protein
MDLLISAFSSIVASTVVYPIDLIKTQFQRTRITQSTVTLSRLGKNLYTKKGFFGFYRGLSSYLVTYPLFWTVYFKLNKINWITTKHKFVDKFIGAYICAGVASLITNPLFVIKVRLQLENRKSKTTNYYKLTNSIYNNEGLMGFFKGYRSSLLNNVKIGMQFSMYDFLMEKTSNVFVSSLIAKSLSSSIFYPFSIVRTNQRDATSKISIRHILKQLYQKYGFLGFYRGVGVYNLVTGPNFVIMMILKEYLTNKLT